MPWHLLVVIVCIISTICGSHAGSPIDLSLTQEGDETIKAAFNGLLVNQTVSKIFILAYQKTNPVKGASCSPTEAQPNMCQLKDLTAGPEYLIRSEICPLSLVPGSAECNSSLPIKVSLTPGGLQIGQKVTALTRTTLLIQWDYRLGKAQLTGSAKLPTGDVAGTCQPRSDKRDNCLIFGLRPGIQYMVTAEVCTNDDHSGIRFCQVTLPMPARTLPEEEKGIEMTGEALKSSSIIARWTDPSPKPGFVRAEFTAFAYGTAGLAEAECTPRLNLSHSCVLSGLWPESSYTLQLRTCRFRANGSRKCWKQWWATKILTPASEEYFNVEAEALGTFSVHVKWRADKIPKGWKASAKTWPRATKSCTDSDVFPGACILADLQPGSRHIVAVEACPPPSKAPKGGKPELCIMSEVVPSKTQPGRDAGPLVFVTKAVRSTALGVLWNSPSDPPRSKIASFHAVAFKTGNQSDADGGSESGGRIEASRCAATEAPGTSCIISNLQPDTNYSVEVTGCYTWMLVRTFCVLLGPRYQKTAPPYQHALATADAVNSSTINVTLDLSESSYKPKDVVMRAYAIPYDGMNKTMCASGKTSGLYCLIEGLLEDTSFTIYAEFCLISNPEICEQTAGVFTWTPKLDPKFNFEITILEETVVYARWKLDEAYNFTVVARSPTDEKTCQALSAEPACKLLGLSHVTDYSYVLSACLGERKDCIYTVPVKVPKQVMNIKLGAAAVPVGGTSLEVQWNTLPKVPLFTGVVVIPAVLSEDLTPKSFCQAPPVKPTACLLPDLSPDTTYTITPLLCMNSQISKVTLCRITSNVSQTTAEAGGLVPFLVEALNSGSILVRWTGKFIRASVNGRGCTSTSDVSPHCVLTGLLPQTTYTVLLHHCRKMPCKEAGTKTVTTPTASFEGHIQATSLENGVALVKWSYEAFPTYAKMLNESAVIISINSEAQPLNEFRPLVGTRGFCLMPHLQPGNDYEIALKICYMHATTQLHMCELSQSVMFEYTGAKTSSNIDFFASPYTDSAIFVQWNDPPEQLIQNLTFVADARKDSAREFSKSCTKVNVRDSFCVISGLQPNTTYEVRVKYGDKLKRFVHLNSKFVKTMPSGLRATIDARATSTTSLLAIVTPPELNLPSVFWNEFAVVVTDSGGHHVGGCSDSSYFCYVSGLQPSSEYTLTVKVCWKRVQAAPVICNASNAVFVSTMSEGYPIVREAVAVGRRAIRVRWDDVYSTSMVAFKAEAKNQRTLETSRCYPAIGSDSCACRVNDLIPGTKYFVSVSVCTREYCNQSSAIEAETLSLTDPVNIVATAKSKDSIEVRWQADLRPGWAEEVNYTATAWLEVADYDSPAATCQAKVSSPTKCLLTGLAASSTYRMVLQKCDLNSRGDGRCKAFPAIRNSTDLGIKPFKVTVAEKTSTSFDVSWQAAPPDDPGTAVTYAVHALSMEASSRAECLAITPNAKHCELTGLLPATEYAIQVRYCVNSGSGKDRNCSLTQPILGRTEPSAEPANVAAMALDATIIQLAWAAKPPKKDTYTYTAHATSEDGSSSATCQSTYSQPQSCYLTGLSPSTLHRTWIEACHGSLKECTNTTASDVRTLPGATTNVKAIALSSTEVRLSWKPPVREDKSTLTYVVIVVGSSNAPPVYTNLTLRGPGSVTVKSLRPFTDYRLILRTCLMAKNKSSCSSARTVTPVTTLPGRPSAPRGFMVRSIMSDRFSAIWRKPSPLTGVLEKYEISVVDENGQQNFTVSALSFDGAFEGQISVKPFKLYNFTVRACNEPHYAHPNEECSEPAYYSRRSSSSAPGPPGDITVRPLSPTSYEVAWQAPRVQKAKLHLGEALTYGIDGITDAKHCGTEDVEDPKCVVADVAANQRYVARAYFLPYLDPSRIYPGLNVESKEVSFLLGSDNFALISVDPIDATRLRLRWFKGQQEGLTTIRVTTDPPSDTFKFCAKQNEDYVTGLKPSTKYTVQITGLGINGKPLGSPVALPADLTWPSPPSEPQIFRVVGAPPSNFCLTWEKPLQANGELDQFFISGVTTISATERGKICLSAPGPGQQVEHYVQASTKPNLRGEGGGRGNFTDRVFAVHWPGSSPEFLVAKSTRPDKIQLNWQDHSAPALHPGTMTVITVMPDGKQFFVSNDDHQYELEGLQPQQEYKVIVQRNTIKSRSRRSTEGSPGVKPPAVIRLTTLSRPPKPMNIEASAPANGTISIRLIGTHALDERTQPAQYVLTDARHNVRAFDIPRTRDGGFKVTGLPPYATYSVSAYACAPPDSSGKGGGCTNSSNTMNVTTWPQAPSEPRDLQIDYYGATQLDISWKRPAVVYGELQRYEAKVCSLSACKSTSWAAEAEAETARGVLTGLSLGQRYVITVTAHTSPNAAGQGGGAGPRSRRIVAETVPGVPTAVRNLTLSQYNQTRMKASWQIPISLNGQLAMQHARLTSADGHNYAICRIKSPPSGSPAAAAAPTDTYTCEFNLDVEPLTIYCVAAQACVHKDKYGRGGRCGLTVFSQPILSWPLHPDGKHPFNIRVLQRPNQTIVISWDALPGVAATFYRATARPHAAAIGYAAVPALAATKPVHCDTPDAAARSCVISGLVANQTYSVSVASCQVSAGQAVCPQNKLGGAFVSIVPSGGLTDGRAKNKVDQPAEPKAKTAPLTGYIVGIVLLVLVAAALVAFIAIERIRRRPPAKNANLFSAPAVNSDANIPPQADK